MNKLEKNNMINEYVASRKYVILNNFVTYMRYNVDLSYTNERAVNDLIERGLTRKRIAFDTENGVKQSRNEFINENGLIDIKPVITKLVTHNETIERVARDVLTYIKARFLDSNFAMGIINFNMYNSEEGIILLFDNKSLKEVLGRIQDKFTYEEKTLIQVATVIRNLSEPSYIRENSYTDTSRHVVDKKFFKYTYEEIGE